jgi:hypothetical protein
VSDSITIHNFDDIEKYIQEVRVAARNAYEWIAQHNSDPFEFMRSVKFEKKGFHPTTHHPLNLIEQVNQTWTYMVALHATKLLLEWHHDAEGFMLAPGANASQELDIMSIKSGLVGAETFAATSPKSNGKLKTDLAKMENRLEKNRYIFFACLQEQYNVTQQHPKLEKPDIQVWSLKL